MAQGLTIKGQVLDSNNEPIIGASIVEKGNTSKRNHQQTSNGNFSFKISGKGKTIVITYIGYQTQELTVTSGKALKSYNEGRCTGYGRSRSHRLYQQST